MINDNAVVDLDDDEVVGSNGGTPITPTQGVNASQEVTPTPTSSRLSRLPGTKATKKQTNPQYLHLLHLSRPS